jgi:hypothetical protein
MFLRFVFRHADVQFLLAGVDSPLPQMIDGATATRAHFRYCVDRQTPSGSPGW